MNRLQETNVMNFTSWIESHNTKPKESCEESQNPRSTGQPDAPQDFILQAWLRNSRSNFHTMKNVSRKNFEYLKHFTHSNTLSFSSGERFKKGNHKSTLCEWSCIRSHCWLTWTKFICITDNHEFWTDRFSFCSVLQAGPTKNPKIVRFFRFPISQLEYINCKKYDKTKKNRFSRVTKRNTSRYRRNYIFFERMFTWS